MDELKMDNNELTEKRALENCKKMWQYIADNALDSKHEALKALWPGHAPILFNCWACEFSKREKINGDYGPDCTKCLLWPAEYGNETHMFGCEKGRNPYAAWVRNHHPRHALKIVQMCDDALVKLEAKE